MRNEIEHLIQSSMEVVGKIADNCSDDIEKLVALIMDAYASGGKLIIFGNGGSAADAQHMSAELVGRFKRERKALAAIALTTNTSILTALANDYSYEMVFERQIEAIARKGDIALGISTSGGAKNVIAGLKKAAEMGLTCAALTGAAGINLKSLTDVCICVPSKDTPLIQQAHIMIIHIVCQLVEDRAAS